MAELPLSEGIDLLARRARTLQILLILGALCILPGALGTMAEMAGMIDLDAEELNGLSAAYGLFAIAELILLVATIILFGMWIFRAAANVVAAGVGGFGYTPAWAVGWHFIPFANFWKPFTAMRQIWNASNGNTLALDANHRLLSLWWTFWLVSNIVSNISLRLSLRGNYEMSLQLDLVARAADLILYPAAYLLVKHLTARQVEGRMSGTVFA